MNNFKYLFVVIIIKNPIFNIIIFCLPANKGLQSHQRLENEESWNSMQKFQRTQTKGTRQVEREYEDLNAIRMFKLNYQKYISVQDFNFYAYIFHRLFYMNFKIVKIFVLLFDFVGHRT